MTEASGPPGLFTCNDTGCPPARQATMTGAGKNPTDDSSSDSGDGPGDDLDPGAFDGPWVDAWLSPGRLARYLVQTTGDRPRALALYEWNTQLGCALQHDLGHLEVALRNAYDTAADAHWPGPGHWLADDADRLFAPLLRTRKSGGAKRQVDVNRRQREIIAKAVREAGGSRATPGKVVAQLSFGFWRYLTSSAHEKTLWVPMLHYAYPPGTRRATVDDQVGRLHDVRNRIAHHEHLLDHDIAALHDDLRHLAGQLLPDLQQYLNATSTVQTLLRRRP